MFRKFRDVILGLTPPSSLNIREPTTIQERVEIKLIIGNAKNIKIENNEKNKDMIQGGHGKKLSWSEVVKNKEQSAKCGFEWTY